MAETAVPPSLWISLMSACTPEMPVPSLPVMVSIVVLILVSVMKTAAKETKKTQTAKYCSLYDKRKLSLAK
jgi:hypothetical protein